MSIIDLIAPFACVFCGVRDERAAKFICDGCRTDLPRNKSPLASHPGLFTAKIAMLRYSFPVDVAVKALKFERKLYYAKALAEILCEAQTILPADIDAIMPIPLHWRRRAVRGFNQATELAQPLAKHLRLPLVRPLRRQRSTPFQSGLDATQRARNLRGAFVARRPIVYQHVLIIDDVVTTGATTFVAGKALLALGVGQVSLLCVASAN